MLKLWQRRALIVLGDPANRTLMLFGAESKQTSRLKVIERALCFVGSAAI